MYRVLYRKWRPEKFSDVIGQEHITTTLRNEIKLGRISHAYLFTGSRGTGKTSCAKILSRAVNCLDPFNGEPCGKCKNCVGIANGSILDVVEMDAASNNSVNDIRAVLEEVVYTPSDAKYRVYIIDEVHMLSSGAYNALLKTLEEPPPHIVFILATTEINKIPATILSRCQRFDFNRIDTVDMAKRLSEIAQAESVSLDSDAAMLIAAVADGAMRDSLSILDRCIGLSDNITTEVVRNTTGLAGRDYLFSLADAVSQNNVVLAINTISDLHKASKSMSLLCEELSEHYRSLMLLKTMKKDASTLILMTDEELKRAEIQAENIDLSQIINCIETLQSTREIMFKGGNNKIEFETCMIKLCTPRLSSDMSSILARLEKLERTYSAIVNNVGNTAVTPVNNPEISVAPKPPETVPEVKPIEKEIPERSQKVMSSAEETIAKLSERAVPMEQWEDVLETMKSLTRVTATAFTGTKAYVVDNFVLIYSDSDTVTKYLKNATQRDKIKEAIRLVTGRNYNLGPYRKPKTPTVQSNNAPVKSKLDTFISNISDSDVNINIKNEYD